MKGCFWESCAVEEGVEFNHVNETKRNETKRNLPRRLPSNKRNEAKRMIISSCLRNLLLLLLLSSSPLPAAGAEEDCCAQRQQIPRPDGSFTSIQLAPFSTGDFVRKARANVGNVRQLRRVLCKAKAGRALHVVVMGGSVTAGQGCNGGDISDSMQGKRCAWPTILETWLNKAFPTSDPSKRHQVENLSERASSSLVAVEIVAPHRNRLKKVDLIIVDCEFKCLVLTPISNSRHCSPNERILDAVNDASNIQIKPHFRKKTEDAERLIANSTTCSSLKGEYRDRLVVATERIVRWSISLPSNPAVIYFQTFNPRVPYHKQAQETHAIVTSYYELPVISYRDAVWHLWHQLRRESGRGECTRLGLDPLCSDYYWTTKGLHPPRHVQ